MAFLENPPPPPPPNIVRFDGGGKPTKAQVEYEVRLAEYLKRFPPGSLLQVVQASTSTEMSNSTTSYADTNLSATITPVSSSNKIFVLVSQQYGLSRTGLGDVAADTYGGIKLMRGSTDLIVPIADGTGPFELGINSWSGVGGEIALWGRWAAHYLDSPATTSSVTYKTQARPYYGSGSSETMYCQFNGSGTSTMILAEIAL